MKVLILNGSPRVKGCTARALQEVADTLRQEGIDTETVEVGSQDIRGCLACGVCKAKGKCVMDDLVNELAPKLAEADGLLVGTPVYYAIGTAKGKSAKAIKALLDRLFHSTGFDKRMKVGAAVVSSRRAGSTSAFDEINKYFTISGMPIVSSNYWNEVHGYTAADVEKDLEGLQTMRTLGRNMAFLIKAIQLGRGQYGLPEAETRISTSFPDGL